MTCLLVDVLYVNIIMDNAHALKSCPDGITSAGRRWCAPGDYYGAS